MSLTIARAKSSSVQRARPSGDSQAVATNRASSLSVSLRSAPGRGSSLSARSRLASTKRRLVRYTVEPYGHPAGNFLVAAAGIGRQQYLGEFELAGGPSALFQHCGEFAAFGWLNSTR